MIQFCKSPLERPPAAAAADSSWLLKAPETISAKVNKSAMGEAAAAGAGAGGFATAGFGGCVSVGVGDDTTAEVPFSAAGGGCCGCGCEVDACDGGGDWCDLSRGTTCTPESIQLETTRGRC